MCNNKKKTFFLIMTFKLNIFSIQKKLWKTHSLLCFEYAGVCMRTFILRVLFSFSVITLFFSRFSNAEGGCLISMPEKLWKCYEKWGENRNRGRPLRKSICIVAKQLNEILVFSSSFLFYIDSGGLILTLVGSWDLGRINYLYNIIIHMN